MYRKSILAALFGVFAVAAAGCDLYCGGPDDDYYTYCDETGCYWCDAWGCYPDYPPCDNGDCLCQDDSDCDMGSYCADDGTCHDSGMCTVDWECPDGFVCDDRNTCVPEGNDNCTADSDCGLGSYCDEASGQCLDSNTCNSDDDCDVNFACDNRGTCIPSACTADDQCPEAYYCDEAAGLCVEGGTCDANGQCADGSECDDRNTCVPCDGGICGACETIDDCDDGEICGADNMCVIPECTQVPEENWCIDRSDCKPIYAGFNCTDPDGNACEDGDTNCTCETFEYAACVSF